jgi:hypothetical protein
MKQMAILVLAAAWTAMAGNAFAQSHPRHGGGGGGGREERVERRQPPPQQPGPPPGGQRGDPRSDPGQRMSPEDRRQLREDIRQHGGEVYRGRDRRP